jgi:ABC-2 type transport system permease protein
MATVVGKETFETSTVLKPAHNEGWLGGFGNLLRKELGQWWGTRAWWVQIIIWLLLLNGVSLLVTLTETRPAAEVLQEVVFTFLPLSVGAVAIGTLIATQGAIVGEKELGTAAWVLSKPASRSAFVLAKVAAYVVGFWISAILIPSALFLLTTWYLVDAPLALLPFLMGAAMVALTQLFYLTLSLMLGTFSSTRGPIAAIGIAFVLTGLLLKGMIPMVVLMVTPWLLPDLSGALAMQLPLPPNWYVPLIATAVWTVLFTALALWRFNREEF